MTETLQGIIDRIADEADDILGDSKDRTQARAGIEETITAKFFSLSPAERAEVLAGVMRILDKEGFFEGPGGDNVWEAEVSGEG